MDVDSCEVSTVIVDNKANPRWTQIEIQSADMPGLLRVLSWVLNGMSVRVQHGVLQTTEDGVAKDTLWVTDFKGRKLSDGAAESLGSRIEDFLIVCKPGSVAEQEEWLCGPIQVSNIAHPDFTQVVIRGEPSSNRPGFLLELASALTSVGASIREAIIQGDADVPHDLGSAAGPNYDFQHEGRYFKFLLVGPRGGKMDADRVASLLFTLRLMTGKGVMPTVAPNMDALLKLNARC